MEEAEANDCGNNFNSSFKYFNFMIADALIPELKHEYASTRKILERVPFESLNWKPHEKSMTLGKLASHVATIPHWLVDIISSEEFDFLKRNYSVPEFNSSQEMLTEFDRLTTKAIVDLQKTSDEKLRKQWTFRRGEHIILSLPKVVAIRSMSISHLIHHRGQLSVYLRLLNVAIPGMYGPSADEPM